jgi:hypothetical protein
MLYGEIVIRYTHIRAKDTMRIIRVVKGAEYSWASMYWMGKAKSDMPDKLSDME